MCPYMESSSQTKHSSEINNTIAVKVNFVKSSAFIILVECYPTRDLYKKLKFHVLTISLSSYMRLFIRYFNVVCINLIESGSLN